MKMTKETLLHGISASICTRRPDIVVMDAWTFGAKDAADVMKVPVIINSPSIGYRIGGRKVPWHPGPFSGLPADMSFADRMLVNQFEEEAMHITCRIFD